MNQQDVVWVSVPFSDFTENKIRPALVISNNEYNRRNQDLIICAITSKLKGDYGIQIDNNDLSFGNLPMKSQIRADKIMHIEKTLVVGSFAKLNDKSFDKLIGEIVKLIERKIKYREANK